VLPLADPPQGSLGRLTGQCPGLIGITCAIDVGKAGHWYASIAWRAEVADSRPPTLPSVGLDRGVAVFAALSDGTKIKPLNAFKAIQDRLAKAQRKLARKAKFSANWTKQKAKITRLHMRAANVRKDFLHKLSTDLAKRVTA
jgi:putative transposase